ncbi:unnamed protein product [Adineta steineri]|uniref:Uncharacterized protein n=1 Tax=Adineta steineri TaxID=433720 RepID=A0A814J1U0_9BILA|nr:unnamed protein product [Adineta steineri]CAF3527083.1 unnamed protein product [Adineta steineri]
MFTSYIIIFSIISGLVLTKPIQEKVTDDIDVQDRTISQAFQQADMVLNRYSYLMKSDTDQLVHAMLLVLINNPTSFPYIPHRALSIVMKNVAQKLGQDDVDILTKPFLLSIEELASNKFKQIPSSSSSSPPSSYELTDDVKIQIEDALDKFIQDQENTSHM